MGNKANKILIIYLSYYFDLIANILGLNVYLIFFPMKVTVLLIFLLYTLNQKRKVKYIKGSIVFFIIIYLIETIAYHKFGHTLNGLVGVKLILYSPIYGNFIISILMILYFYNLDNNDKIQFARYFYRFINTCNKLYILFWFIPYFNIIDDVSGSFTSNNYVSYHALTLLYINILILKRKIITFDNVSSITLILLNSTRGASVLVGVILVNAFYIYIFKSKKISLFFNIFTISLAIYILSFPNLISNTILGNNFNSYISEVSDQIVQQKDDKQFINYRGTNFESDQTTSAVNRIYINFLGIEQMYNQSLLFGLGIAKAYKIEVNGDGIHSLIYLILVSTGIIGTIFFIVVYFKLIHLTNNSTLINEITIYLFLVLHFINAFYSYFILLFITSYFLKPLKYAKR